jgi:hypothetical protein
VAGIYPQGHYSSLEGIVRIMKLADEAQVGAVGFR